MRNCHLKAQLLLFKLENNVIKSGSEAENATFPQELTPQRKCWHYVIFVSHSVEIPKIYFQNSKSKYFEKPTYVVELGTYSNFYTFSRNIFQVRVNFTFFHTVSLVG